MADISYIGGVAPLLGGWFNYDGASLPEDVALTDGWFGETDCPCDELRVMVENLEQQLLECEPVFIDDDGHLHEIDIDIGGSP